MENKSGFGNIPFLNFVLKPFRRFPAVLLFLFIAAAASCAGGGGGGGGGDGVTGGGGTAKNELEFSKVPKKAYEGTRWGFGPDPGRCADVDYGKAENFFCLTVELPYNAKLDIQTADSSNDASADQSSDASTDTQTVDLTTVDFLLVPGGDALLNDVGSKKSLYELSMVTLPINDPSGNAQSCDIYKQPFYKFKTSVNGYTGCRRIALAQRKLLRRTTVNTCVNTGNAAADYEEMKKSARRGFRGGNDYTGNDPKLTDDFVGWGPHFLGFKVAYNSNGAQKDKNADFDHVEIIHKYDFQGAGKTERPYYLLYQIKGDVIRKYGAPLGPLNPNTRRFSTSTVSITNDFSADTGFVSKGKDLTGDYLIGNFATTGQTDYYFFTDKQAIRPATDLTYWKFEGDSITSDTGVIARFNKVFGTFILPVKYIDPTTSRFVSLPIPTYNDPNDPNDPSADLSIDATTDLKGIIRSVMIKIPAKDNSDKLGKEDNWYSYNFDGILDGAGRYKFTVSTGGPVQRVFVNTYGSCRGAKIVDPSDKSGDGLTDYFNILPQQVHGGIGCYTGGGSVDHYYRTFASNSQWFTCSGYELYKTDLTAGK